MKKLIVFIALVILFSTCKKNKTDNSTQPNNPPITNKDTIVNENVHIIDSAKLILNSDTAVLNQGRYEFTFTGTAPDFKINDIIVGATNGGYIRKLSGVNRQTNTIILETTQGDMEDVFQNANFAFNTALDSLNPAKMMSGFHFDVSDQTVYQNGPLTIKLDNGVVDIDGDWEFGFRYRNSKVESFEMACNNATLKGQFNLNVSASQPITVLENNSILARKAKYTTFFVGYVPVVLYTEVELRCIFSASLDAAIQSNFVASTDNSVDVGIKYINSQWQNTYAKTSNSSISINDPSGNVNAGIKMAIVPFISFRLYRILGPYASLGLQETIEANVASPSLDWDFYAGAWLQTIIGVKASILGKSLFDTNKEWNTDTVYYQTPDGIEKVSGDNQTGIAGQFLSNVITVKIKDSRGNKQSNVPVYFNVIEGGGSVEESSVLTDVAGEAKTRWKLGNQVGTQTLEVKAKNANGDLLQNAPIEFTASTNQQTEDSIFTDTRDGHTYGYRHIGSQVWMTQNMNFEIPSPPTDPLSWCYNREGGKCDTYGRLYKWAEAFTAVPAGWHLPSDNEWQTLINFLGGDDEAGGAMKTTTGWWDPNIGASNSSGFSALPGGWLLPQDGAFNFIGQQGNWWTSTPSDADNAWFYSMYYGNPRADKYANIKTAIAISVRCVRD